MAKYLTKQTIVERVDPKTGEITELETTKDFKISVKPENFYMVFLNKIAALYGITAMSDMKVMMTMCELAEYNTGTVRMSKNIREVIAQKANVNPTNISKHIKKLQTIGLVTEINKDYLINPEIFWKGTLRTRAEQLQVDGIKFNITLVSDEI